MKFTNIERKPVFECMCCGYVTLTERHGYEICPACGWEDEEIGDTPDHEMIGGANGDYTMNEARENFRIYGRMYRPGDHRFYTDPKIIEVHKRVLNALEEIKQQGWTPERASILSSLTSKELSMRTR